MISAADREEDNLVGGPGSDSLDGGFGADGLDGGADGDVVTYAGRTEAVTVDFTDPAFQAHGSSNDGPPGLRDHIQNVETVVGGTRQRHDEGGNRCHHVPRRRG